MDRPVRRRRGRAPATDRAQLSRIGLDLMIERGFDAVTIDDIAAAAGIARRTYFSYFPSKSELVWGDFDRLLEGFRARLDATAADSTVIGGIRDAVQEFNRVPEDETDRHRERMRMIIQTPQLVAHSAVRYADWRAVIVDYVARRQQVPATSVVPLVVSWACLGVSMSAYDRWVLEPEADLLALIDEGFVGLRDVFSDVLGAVRDASASR